MVEAVLYVFHLRNARPSRQGHPGRAFGGVHRCGSRYPDTAVTGIAVNRPFPWVRTESPWSMAGLTVAGKFHRVREQDASRRQISPENECFAELHSLEDDG